jgi:transcription-repair coupling factor (superfamily II helicase)
MNKTDLSSIYYNHPSFQALQDSFNANSRVAHLKGMNGSSFALFSAGIIQNKKTVHLFVVPDKEDAAFLYNDLANVLDEGLVLFFPSSYKKSIAQQETDEAGIILRTRALNTLKDISDIDNYLVVVTYPEALVEKVTSVENLNKNTLELKVSEKISISFIREVLYEYKFEETEFVYEPGQFSVRGSIVDIFSFSNNLPYRIDFFGEEVESIRTFEVDTQLSKEKFSKITIIPNIGFMVSGGVSLNLLELLPASTFIWSKDLPLIKADLEKKYDAIPEKLRAAEGVEKVTKEKLVSAPDELMDAVTRFFNIEAGVSFAFNSGHVVNFRTIPQPSFKKNFELLTENLNENESKGFRNYIVSDNTRQIQRLKDIFASISDTVVFEPVDTSIHEGFIDNNLKICLYTDHQIFERYHKYNIRHNFSKSDSLTINEIKGLNPGDYVVHIDHGIGVFGGLQKVEVNGKMQETITLIYKDNDVLFVNIHNLHKISKYKGKEGESPKIYKLGTPAWQNLKQSTKKKVKDIARDLINLYAKRKAEEGFRFSPDTYLQEELEASFIYEDTPDQEKATRAVKMSMEAPYPMDHLVCGDVGFGKTEIAVRAAFKAVTDSKQVAILVPTTILALQHYNTFKDRLEKFPCKVEYISRLKPPKEQKEVLHKLEKGEVDILIGTHKLVGKEIKFKDLGLLIVDEEQKFGVAVKEKLKHLKVNVDTLTLTATPIPRTLQFSLMGARDLSIINTPPPNRHPIHTELNVFNETTIREAIDYEISRGGQVFFIHNRVDNLPEIQLYINKVCPGVKTVFAHGQMEGPKLEQIMLDFINGDFDVLISTTIVESGLDIPNANTILINNAHMFGLSDLHQLRGRVGRANKKAFCYLLAPPTEVLTPEARRRLKAIEDFSDLGSGFNIAMQDLDIRGAGDLLGAEQSGFISDIGYETYQRILSEAMLELREDEFKDLYSQEDELAKQQHEVSYVSDCQIDTDLELLFPDSYVKNISERMRLYRELDNIDEENKLKEFEQQLVDRFGTLPKASAELMDVVRLRWKAQKLGIEKIIMKSEKMLAYFISNQNSPFYHSPVFDKLILYIQKNPRVFQMKEAKDKLSMVVENIKSVRQAIDILSRLE